MNSVVYLSERARLAELKDDREALTARLIWVSKSPYRTPRVKRMRDFWAARLAEVHKEIRRLEKAPALASRSNKKGGDWEAGTSHGIVTREGVLA